MKYLTLFVLCFCLSQSLVAQWERQSEVTFNIRNGMHHTPVPVMEIVLKDSARNFTFSVYADSSGNATLKLPINRRFHFYVRDPNPEIQYYDTRMDTFTTDSSVKRIAIETDLMDISTLSRIPVISFKSGSAELSAQMKTELDSFISYFGRYRALLFALDGHTDVKGNAKDNFELSKERAQAVYNYIEAAHTQNNFIMRAYGAYEPVYDCNKMKCTPEQRQQNDRVHIHYIKRKR